MIRNSFLSIIAAIAASVIVGKLILDFQIFSFAIVFVVLVNFLIFTAPQYFILFWMLLGGYSSNIHFAGGITSYGVMNMLFLPSLALKLIFDYRKEIVQFPLIKCYVLFLIIYFFSIWYSPESHLLCFRRYLNFIIPFFMTILIIGSFRNERVIRQYVKITLVVTAVLGVVSTLMFLSGKWMISGDISRATGLWGHPNFYALFLNFQLGVSLSLAIFLTEKKEQLLYYTISLILCLSLIPTFAKGAYVTCFLIVMTLSVLAVSLKKQVRHLFIAGGFMLLCVLFGVTFFSHTIMLRLDSQNTLIWRMGMWKNLVMRVLESPVWGHGYLSHFRLAGDELGISAGFSPHSQYLEILLDTGLLGLGAFVMVYWGIFQYSLRIFRVSQVPHTRALALGIAISMGGLLFNSFTESAFFVPMLSLYLWFYFGFLVSLLNLEHKTAANQDV